MLYHTSDQGWQYVTVRYASMVQYASILSKKYGNGSLVRFVIFVEVLVGVRWYAIEMCVPNVSYQNDYFQSLKTKDGSRLRYIDKIRTT